MKDRCCPATVSRLVLQARQLDSRRIPRRNLMMSVFAVLFVTLFRLFPHAPNFAPMGAVAILSGRTQSKKNAILTIIAAMVVSDLALSRIYGYPFLGFVSLFVYGAFILQAFLGRAFRQKTGGSMIAALLGACLFFVITNLGVWMQGLLYARTLDGLLQCYLMALPFFKMTLIGNLVWTPVLTAAYRLYQNRFLPQAKTLPVV